LGPSIIEELIEIDALIGPSEHPGARAGAPGSSCLDDSCQRGPDGARVGLIR